MHDGGSGGDDGVGGGWSGLVVANKHNIGIKREEKIAAGLT